MLPGATTRTLLLLVAGLIVACGISQARAQPPDALNYPNVITYGVFTGTICYSNSVSVKTLTPITTRTFTFTPAGTTTIVYIICYNNLLLHPFDATIVGAGLGVTGTTSIVLTSSTGKLYANCDVYCA